MATTLHSDNWYRVQGLHPRLRNHVEVQRRNYRGATWYVLRDTSTGRHHRISETAYQVVGRLNGEQTVEEIWQTVRAKLASDAPTQDEVISLLGSLHESHLIQSEINPDVDEIFHRRDMRTRRQRTARVNPLSFRVPLVDPAAFLDRHVRLVRPLFTRAGLALWMTVVAVGALALLPHWSELVAHGGRLLETRQILLLVLVYPVIKALHELGHAFAVRVWDGEVREMGVALMLFIPVPYVDASAATAFRERRRRIIVSAAGIMVELLLAALAGLFWLVLEDGFVRDIAFTVMAIGGVSTALFNGNPLMRLDGYYVLSDALEIPNLSARANQCCFVLLQRGLLGARPTIYPAADGFERWFLPLYGIASAVYRLGISLAVLLWVSAKSATLAVILALWMAVLLLLLPMRRAIGFLLDSPTLSRRRGLAIGNAVLLCAGLLLAMFVLPFPAASTAQGVVWFPENAHIRASASGFVEQVHAQDGTQVSEGAAIIDLDNPALRGQLARREAHLLMLHSRMRQAMRERSAALQPAAQEVAAAEAEVADLRRRVEGLSLRAPASGRLVLPRGEDLPGSFVRQGATLGHVVTDDDMVVRVAVTQQQAARIRDGVAEVAVRKAEAANRVMTGHVAREVPGSDTQLPSAALGDRGGGALRTDPQDKDGLKTLEPVYYFDIGIRDFTPERVGGRAYVRFEHAAEPLGLQAVRALRQMFLRQTEG